MDLPRRHLGNRFAEVDNSVSSATKLGLILWLASTYWYKKQFRVANNHLFNLAMFSTGSLFSSMAIARFLFESPHAAAARRNNYEELKHQRQMGKF